MKPPTHGAFDGHMLKRLQVNPIRYVESLESPIGIYLRREVFKKENAADETLRKELYEKIASSQSADGSWTQLFMYTANNLWNLCLLGYNADDVSVKKGLKWLLAIQRGQYRGYPGFFVSPNRRETSIMRSTHYGEFGPGCTVFFQTTYAVHLFHLFGFDDNRQVRRAVKSYLQFWTPKWCGAWCTLNVLRMLIEHPLSAESQQVQTGLKYLAKRQSKRGAWKGFPFYHTFHVLSKTSHALAKRQFEKAFPLIAKRQNKDGSWGRKERQTAVFLVLDALKHAQARSHKCQ